MRFRRSCDLSSRTRPTLQQATAPPPAAGSRTRRPCQPGPTRAGRAPCDQESGRRRRRRRGWRRMSGGRGQISGGRGRIGCDSDVTWTRTRPGTDSLVSRKGVCSWAGSRATRRAETAAKTSPKSAVRRLPLAGPLSLSYPPAAASRRAGSSRNSRRGAAGAQHGGGQRRIRQGRGGGGGMGGPAALTEWRRAGKGRRSGY